MYAPIRNISTLLKKVNFKPCFTVKKQHKASLPRRTDKPIMKLDSLVFKSTVTDDVKYLCEIFSKGGYEIKIAGGAVRDLVLGNIPHDIDFATTATPAETKKILENHKIRTINSRGEYHGTITARYNDKNYEITTLRTDVVTNGRHAEVEFIKDWFLDASRRDLTINSLFLDVDGQVYDYFNGIDDLKNRRVVFVGNASKRIKEDYLRILRYFRFFGDINSPLDSFDNKTINDIISNAVGLNNISGERIRTEMFKIIKGNNGIEILKKILSIKIGVHMGFPEGVTFDELDRISGLIQEHKFDMNPITILSAVIGDEIEMRHLVSRMKTSAYERDLGLFVVQQREKKKEKEHRLSDFQNLTLLSSNKRLMREAVKEYLMYAGEVDLLKKYLDWREIQFPVTGTDIIQHKEEYKTFANAIREKLIVKWVESNFTLMKSELLEHIDDVASEVSANEFRKLKKRKIRSSF